MNDAVRSLRMEMHLESPEVEAPVEVVAEPEPVFCSYCREQILHDGEIWRHIRTGLSADWRSKECHPSCRDCDKEGLIAIGADQFVGSGIRFVIDHFACLEHASKHVSFKRT